MFLSNTHLLKPLFREKETLMRRCVHADSASDLELAARSRVRLDGVSRKEAQASESWRTKGVEVPPGVLITA